MQKSLLRWKCTAFCFSLLICLTCSVVKGQIRYTFSAFTTTYTALSNPTSTAINGSNDNALSGASAIGFTFSYGCNTYTEFKASSNGWISLGNNTTQNMSGNLLSITGNGPIIAPLWDDLYTSNAGVIYKTTGSSPNRVCTIQWSSMRWSSSTNNAVISFQVKLYETSNTIDFIYSQNANNVSNGSASIGINGGVLATDFYSVSAVTTGAVATYGVETNNINQKPATNQVFRWTPNDMGYISSTATQTVTSSISKCNNLRQLAIGVQVVMRGCRNPASATEFKINMLGTTAIADVSAIHIYYTGLVAAYAPIQEYGSGSITPAAGVISVTGSQVLKHGTNYFWIVYDINPAATAGNVVDAQCTQVTVGGGTQNLTTQNPTGTRTIANCSTAPGGITNASFWIKGNIGTSSTTDNTLISYWNDQSGNSRHATNANADHQPRFYDNASKNLNFNPVVDFDEAGQDDDYADFMDIASNGILPDGNTPYEVYAVIVPGAANLTTPGKFLFAGEAGAGNFNAFDVRGGYSINDSWNMNDLIVPNVWAVDDPLMLTFDYNCLQREAFKAGTSVGTYTSPARTALSYNNALAYQRTGNLEFYDGSIAEIITYANTSHSTTTREKVETYLAIKYGITLPHNYLASNNTVVWNRATNAAYNYNIIGIGRDNNGALLQKQSKSTSSSPDILTVYVGPTKMTNQTANTGSILAGDLSFFMVGSNNDIALNKYPGTNEKPASICCRIFREWLVQKTNFTNTDVKLEFDFNAITTGYLPLNASDLRLLVDADGDFTNATVLNTPTITINAAAGIATITVAASVFNSTPYFTLASVSVNTILPLQLKALSGLCKDQAVQVKWTTGTAATADFSVERSNDKVNFSTAGTVKPNASGSYAWTDQSPLPGTIYYRLKTTNENSMVLYSPIITVNSCNTTGIQLSTNPVTNESTLMLQLSQNNITEISLYDLMGRRSEVAGLTGKRSMEKGVHYLPVNIPGTVAGMYLLHVVVNGEPHVYRIIKK